MSAMLTEMCQLYNCLDCVTTISNNMIYNNEIDRLQISNVKYSIVAKL